MEIVCIPQGQTPSGNNRLFLDFLSRFDRVRDFYHRPPTLDAVEQSAREISFDPERRAKLVEALTAQNQSGDESVAESLARLAEPDAVAIVSGQQTGFFGGPAYSVYKALTAVRWASELERRGVKAVPVFWMATEDHDLEEVSPAWILNREGRPVRLEATVSGRAGGPAGPTAIGPADLAALEESVFGLDWAQEAVELARAAYGGATTFGKGFKTLFQRIFAGRGLILLDPLDPALRRLAAPAFRAALEQADSIHEALTDRGAELQAAGYAQQVKIPEHGTLLFTIRNGRRRPLVRDGESFVLDGERISLQQALELVESAPETFSPNALLRPSVQDVMLPTAAYIGGPAEVAYMAQAEVVFERVAGRMPVILPRASVTLVDRRRARLLKKYGLRVQDCWTHHAALDERIARSLIPDDLNERLERGRGEIEATLGRLEGSLRDFDPTLAEALEHSRRKIRYQLDKLHGKTAREALRRGDRAAGNARELLDWFYPHNAPQERLLSIFPLWARFGPPLLDSVEQAIRPECLDHQAISL
jgi:bacillithiol synthase